MEAECRDLRTWHPLSRTPPLSCATCPGGAKPCYALLRAAGVGWPLAAVCDQGGGEHGVCTFSSS
jgi:hypothetical protein